MLAKLQRNITWQRALDISQWMIPLLAIYFIWVIIDSKTLNATFLTVWQNTFSNLNWMSFFSLMFILTSLNLFLESLKWKFALQKINSISYSEAFIQTLKAMAAGFITPFRSGALFARIIANENTDKLKILNATIQMAVAQFSVTFLVGLSGLSYWLFEKNEMSLFYITISVLLIFILFGIYFMQNPPKLNFKNKEWNGLSFDLRLILISFIRYFIFTLQYVLLLSIFGAEIEMVTAFCLVSITFLVNTLLPTGILGKIGIRELSGIMIIGEATGFVLEVSCAAFMIWILNQALPAILGSILFLSGNSRVN